MTFLHNEQFFAVAQKKYAYIYDKRGLEVHCLKETVEPYRCGAVAGAGSGPAAAYALREAGAGFFVCM